MKMNRWIKPVALAASALGLAAYLLTRTALGQAGVIGAVQPPDGITLLPGYHYTKISGDDSNVGTISKPGGMTLQFDVPMYANTAGGGGAGVKQEIDAIKQVDLLWRKRQTIHGLSVEIALAKDRRIFVAYPQADAGFWGTAKTEEDVADALLMVLTYHSPPRLPAVGI